MSDSEADRGQFLRGCLERFGSPRDSHKWKTGDVNYVTALELTAADVPVLLTVAREWADSMDWPDDEDYVAGYAPIHAWRSLAHLRATEAIDLLLGMMDPLDEVEDDWYLEEFPHAFAWIGPASLQALGKYLADAGHLTYPRATAASGLSGLAKRHPETRQEAVRALCQTLSRFQETDHAVNGFIISELLDLKATEAAELIERAYAADCVDISILGNWHAVREELGVPGLGLVPEKLADVKWGWVPNALADRQDEEFPFHGGQNWLPSAQIDDAAVPAKASKKVGRNEPCPCGSGKKYKKCCGR